MLWTTIETDEAQAEALGVQLGVSTAMARLLTQRGMSSPELAEEFLRPRLAMLDDPFALTHMDAAVARIERAIERREDLVVFGDYDVDGVTSTVQLISLLRTLGLAPRFCVPRRLEEGYGISREAIDRVFAGRAPDLFIALDCGTNAHRPIGYLRELGVDVIIVDHHQSKTRPPTDCVLVNPHVHDPEDAPWRDLCTAGLVFKLLHGILKRRREAQDPRVEAIRLKDYLDLVALGTVADLVPLQRENRILSWFGLQHLRANGRPGIRALASVSGLDAAQEMDSVDISFRLGPRINASGRLADAELPIELLLSDCSTTCKNIAGELDAMNRDRQTIERRIASEAERRADDEFTSEPGIVLFDPDWHPGVVGIVASRVSRRFHKPCVILGAEENDAKGSGRGIGGVDLVQVFHGCADLLGHWGGHPMAAGVSLPVGKVDEFARRFNACLRQLHPAGLPEPSLEIAAWLHPEQLDATFLTELDRLHPFGMGNSEPIFGLRGIALQEPPQSFGNANFRFRVPAPSAGAKGIAGVAWRMDAVPQPGCPIDLAVRFGWNHFRGNRYPQLTLIEWRKHTP